MIDIKSYDKLVFLFLECTFAKLLQQEINYILNKNTLATDALCHGAIKLAFDKVVTGLQPL